MNKRLILYGLALALLVLGLKLIEYKLVIRDHSLELYVGIIAAIFMLVGVLTGRKMKSTETVQSENVATPPQPLSAELDAKMLETLNISKREYEILQLMAEGLSNQEIAERTFVSIHTVKTHVSNLLLKLDAKRRTQAVIKARELKLI